jgi:DNA-binding NarL/FixJ family response regulator
MEFPFLDRPFTLYDIDLVMGKVKVAVVDDVEEIRSGFSFLINSSDECECVGSFSNAEDLLAKLDELVPQVVILDIGLPGMSGIDCCREIKAKLPKSQIIICTVYEDDERLFSALKAGASGYILKRTSPGLLMDAIKELHNGGAPMSPQIGRKVIESFQGNLPVPEARAEVEYDLSKREKEILELLAAGYRNKEIADRLFISSHTVRSHIYHIYEKLHVKSRVEALNKLSGKR